MMLHPAIPSSLLLLAAPALGVVGPQRATAPPPVLSVTQMTIHERIIIRMPIARGKPLDQASPIVWKEKHGPKCIGIGDLGGALISSPSSVDLVLAGGKRIRAKLDGDCQPLDFYGGFYIKPGIDGQVCEDRDSIRVRSGASCRIDSFKRLVAKRRSYPIP